MLPGVNEETGEGAKGMVDDGLFKRIPVNDPPVSPTESRREAAYLRLAIIMPVPRSRGAGGTRQAMVSTGYGDSCSSRTGTEPMT